MTPTLYYEEPGIQIFHGDCRERLVASPGLLLLTDPPYGIGLSSNDTTGATGRGSERARIRGDDSQCLGIEVLRWAEQEGLATVVFASAMKPWPGEWRQHLVWDKGGAVGGGGDTATCWKQTWELIQIARTGELAGGRDEAVLRFPMRIDMMTLHPAQKSLALIRYLLSKVMRPGMKVFDPFMGSGTTLVSSKALGVSALGIEIEERYCETAANRLRQSVMTFGLEYVG